MDLNYAPEDREFRAAEAALPQADADGRGDLVPALLRAERGLGPREPQDPSRGSGRPLPRERPEDLDLQWAHRGLGHLARPHRPEGAEAPGYLVRAAQHAPARGGGPPAQADHRKLALLRSLHDERPRGEV